jgi:hypothetical protein
MEMGEPLFQVEYSDEGVTVTTADDGAAAEDDNSL